MLIDIFDNEIGEAVSNVVNDLDYRSFATADLKGLVETQKPGVLPSTAIFSCAGRRCGRAVARGIHNALAAAPAERARA